MLKNALTRTLYSLCTLAVVAGLAACGGESADASSAKNPDTLSIAVIPSEDETNLDQRYAKVAEVLEQATGKKVDFYQATSYAAVIEAQRAGKAQIAAYGPFSYVLAKDGGVHVDLIGYGAKSQQDPGGYTSVLSVRAGSSITSVADLKGKNVCFVDPASTSGYLFPTSALLDNHLDPEKDVTAVMAGGHDASVLAVASGRCDAGFSTKNMATEQLIKSGQIKQAELRQIWESDTIPPSPVTVSSDLDPGLIQQIKDAYLNDMNVDALQAAGNCAEGAAAACGLPSETLWGYRSVSDDVFDGIRRVCDVTKAAACTSVD